MFVALPLSPRNLVFAIGLLVSIITIAGCGGTYHVNTDHGDDGTTVITMDNNEIKVEGAMKFHAESLEGNYTVEKQLYVNLRKIEREGEDPTFAFLVNYIGMSYLKIEKGRSLELIVDGRSHYFSGEGEVRRQMDPSGDLFTERVDYPVKVDFLIRLIEAETIGVVVNGHDGEVQGYFDSDNIGALRRFVADYVPQIDPEH
jgi:hypothetical protein